MPQNFSTSHALTNQQWSLGVEAEVLKRISFSNFMGSDSSSLIQVKDELKSKAGDTINFGLRMQLTDAPISGVETSLEGNERTIQYYSDSLSLDVVAQAARWYNETPQQRVNFENASEGRYAVADNLSHSIDTSLFNQLAGYTVESENGFIGNNTVTAPDSDHKIYSGTGNSGDEDLLSGEEFDLDLIDAAVEKAKTLSPAIRPAYVPALGGEFFVCFVHPYQVSDLRVASTRWDGIQRDILKGGGEGVSRNPLLTGALGIYNGTLLVESSRVPQGVHSTTGAAETDVRRAIFCGAQSAVLGWGRLGGQPNRFSFQSETFDYGRQGGVAASCLYGLKRTIFNSESFASIVIATYAIAS